MATDPAATATFATGRSGRSHATGRSRPCPGAADPPRIELQRARRLVSVAEAVRDLSFGGMPAAEADGGVSRETFDEHLNGREAALLAAFEQTLTLAAERASVAFHGQDGWADRIRAALVAVLEFFDEEPALARYCVVGSAQAGPVVLARRGEVLDHECAPARGYPPPLTAEAVVSGVLGVLHGRLSRRDPGVLVALCNSLMSFIVLPFVGARAARRELSRPAASAPVARSLPVDLHQAPAKSPKHRRTPQVLSVIAGEPGLSNREVALRAGVKDQAHISRLLARLQRLGLVENKRDDRMSSPANAWHLTVRGHELERTLGQQAPEPPSSVDVDLPRELVGLLDNRAVLVLRVIGEQPWLSNREVALRMGVEDRAQVSHLLRRLAGLGLASSTRDTRRRGSPNAWQLTASGEQLHAAIGRETAVPARSVALHLMRDLGGRLSERAVYVLRVIGDRPGLSNGEVAIQSGIGAPTRMSQLLAHLAQRGLVENARSHGRENHWQLTARGEELERAIWNETPAVTQRTVAVELLGDRGARLNHRVVSVLKLIADEPGHSNNEIALHEGIQGKGHASRLLARLARFGLIENTRTTGRENAWQLTASGRELERTIRHEDPHAGR